MTSNHNKSVLSVMGMAMAATCLFGGIPSAVSAQPAAYNIVSQAGTVIPITLDEQISSNNSQVGDSFSATVQSGNADGFPAGTKVEGVVKTATAQQDSNPGVLALGFRRLILPDGRAYTIEGSLVGLDGNSVTQASDGRLVAKSNHKTDQMAYIGYGAGAGLLVGVLAKKNPVEDTLLGAGLGYLVNELQKSHSDARDVTLASGTPLGVRLDKRLSIANNTNPLYHRSGANWNGPGTLSNIGVMIDDQPVRFYGSARPFTSGGVLLVPAASVLSAANVPFHYGGRQNGITAQGNAGTVRLGIGSRVAIVNGSQRVLMAAPAQVLNGIIYVPMQYVGLATNSNVGWDSSSRTAILTSR